MYYWLFHPLVACALGAFATAYMHEQTGRDPRTGGIMGAAVGFFCGYAFLVSLWVWLYYNRLNVHVINRRRRWFEWWRP